MLRIDCPYCGVRDESEFIFGGQAHLMRPDPTVDDSAWTEYLFTRDNPVGLHFERWLHSYGCNRWFNVARDTLTHKIALVYAMGSPSPRIESTQ